MPNDLIPAIMPARSDGTAVCMECGCEYGVAAAPYWSHGEQWSAEAIWTCDRCDHEQRIQFDIRRAQPAATPAAAQKAEPSEAEIDMAWRAFWLGRDRDDSNAKEAFANALRGYAAMAQPAASAPDEDIARHAFWGAYPDGDSRQCDIWMAAFRWSRFKLAAPIAAQQPVVAWMDDGSTTRGVDKPSHRVITAETKANMPASVAQAYSTPLGVIGAAQQDAADAALIAVSKLPDNVRVERAGQTIGPDLWAVRLRGHCLSTTGKWDHEPLSSERSDEWLAAHRFQTATAAISAARAAMKGDANGHA